MTAAPLSMTEEESVIMQDLMRKVGDDVEAAIDRVVDIAPRPLLPVLAAATSAMISLITEIDRLNNQHEPDRRMTPPQLAMLAALFAGRVIVEGNVGHALQEANADLQALKHAARDVAMTIAIKQGSDQ